MMKIYCIIELILVIFIAYTYYTNITFKNEYLVVISLCVFLSLFFVLLFALIKNFSRSKDSMEELNRIIEENM